MLPNILSFQYHSRPIISLIVTNKKQWQINVWSEAYYNYGYGVHKAPVIDGFKITCLRSLMKNIRWLIISP